TALGLWQRWDARSSSELSSTLLNLRMLIGIFGIVNIHLALFNLVPLPPLDGAHIMSNLSPGYARAMHSFVMSGGAIFGLLIVFTLSANLISPAAIRISTAYLDLIRNPSVQIDDAPRPLPLRRRFGEED